MPTNKAPGYNKVSLRVIIAWLPSILPVITDLFYYLILNCILPESDSILEFILLISFSLYLAPPLASPLLPRCSTLLAPLLAPPLHADVIVHLKEGIKKLLLIIVPSLCCQQCRRFWKDWHITNLWTVQQLITCSLVTRVKIRNAIQRKRWKFCLLAICIRLSTRKRWQLLWCWT